MGFFGFGTSRAQDLKDFAQKACISKQTITIKLNEARILRDAIVEALIEKGMESRKAQKKVRKRLILECPKCGQFTKDARDLAFLGGEGSTFREMNVRFGGPTAKALFQGHCPICSRSEVIAIFDPGEF